MGAFSNPPECQNATAGGDYCALQVFGGTRKRSQPFVFMSIFKWERRKGWQTLLKAYLQVVMPPAPLGCHLTRLHACAGLFSAPSMVCWQAGNGRLSASADLLHALRVFGTRPGGAA